MSKTTITSLATLAGASLFFSSCGSALNPSTHYAYTSLGVNTPLFKQKNESQLTGQIISGVPDDYSDKARIIGANFQGGYAISKHIGIMASYSYSAEKERYNIQSSEAEKLKYKKDMAEVGIGYFTPFSKSGKIFFEVYAGLGTGGNHITRSYDEPDFSIYHKSRINKFFVQPAVAFHSKNNLRLGWAVRASFINYSHVSTNYTDEMLQGRYVKLYEIDKYSFVFLEPGFFIQIPLGKLDWLRINGQANAAIKLNNRNIYYRYFMGGFGVTFIPPTRKK